MPDSILVEAHGNGHDRKAGAPSRNPAHGSGASLAGPAAARDMLGAALQGLRLDGAIFFRAEFTERWAYLSPTPDQLIQILRPGAKRLIIFHIVAAGSAGSS